MRKSVRNVLVIALFLGGALCSSAAADPLDLGLDLLDKAGSTAKMLCPEGEVFLWGKAHHPGGAGNLNENNRGLGLRCYHDTSFWGLKAYGEADELRNSQRGRATILGLGVQKELFSWGSLSADLAFGYVRVGYEIPTYDVTLYRWVWTTNADIAYKISDKLGTVTLNVLPVPQGTGGIVTGAPIWLWWAGWRKQF